MAMGRFQQSNSRSHTPFNDYWHQGLSRNKPPIHWHTTPPHSEVVCIDHVAWESHDDGSVSTIKFKVSYPVQKLLILVDGRDDYNTESVHTRPQGHLGVPTLVWDILGLVFSHARDLGGGDCLSEFQISQTPEQA